MNDYRQERKNGTMEIVPLDKPPGISDRYSNNVASYSRYVWHPPDQVTRLPEWFQLALDCSTNSSGTRWFGLVDVSNCHSQKHPGLERVATWRGLSLVASIGGYRLMLERGEVPKDPLLTPDQSRLYLRHVEHRREYFGQRKGMALEVRGSQRDIANGSVLPDGLGLGPSGEGKAWKKSELTRRGTAAAHSAGIVDPSERQILSYGLTEAAKSNPLKLHSSELTALVRMTLFALPESTKKLAKRELKYVALHVGKSLSEHLNDTDEEFEKWIVDPTSNLLHRIAKRSDCPMSRDQVKHGMLELGWRALLMLGKCIDTQMRTFRDAIPVALTRAEDQSFKQRYLADKIYAGLPLLLLHDRFADLSAAIIYVWSNPGKPQAVQVLYRVMSYYAELFGNRRKVEREYKRRSLARNARGQIASSSTIHPDTQSKSKRKRDVVVLEVAKALARDQRIDCDFGEWEAEAALLKTSIRIELRRAEPSFLRTFTISTATFKEIEKKLRESDELM
jgi:hypothetical protein